MAGRCGRSCSAATRVTRQHRRFRRRVRLPGARPGAARRRAYRHLHGRGESAPHCGIAQEARRDPIGAAARSGPWEAARTLALALSYGLVDQFLVGFVTAIGLLNPTASGRIYRSTCDKAVTRTTSEWPCAIARHQW